LRASERTSRSGALSALNSAKASRRKRPISPRKSCRRSRAEEAQGNTRCSLFLDKGGKSPGRMCETEESHGTAQLSSRGFEVERGGVGGGSGIRHRPQDDFLHRQPDQRSGGDGRPDGRCCRRREHLARNSGKRPGDRSGHRRLHGNAGDGDEFPGPAGFPGEGGRRSEEHTSESSHVKISYAVFCLKKKK